jgi:hypothetical protein
MSPQKKKIPDSFRYNRVDFVRKSSSVNPRFPNLKTKRKSYKNDGYYTKVKKFGNQTILYVSKTKRETVIEKRLSKEYEQFGKIKPRKIPYKPIKWTDEEILAAVSETKKQKPIKKSVKNKRIENIRIKIRETREDIENQKSSLPYVEKESKKYREKASKATNEPMRKLYEKQSRQVVDWHWSDIRKNEKKIFKYEDKIEEHKLDFNKINKLLDENFSKSVWRKGGGRVKGYGAFTKGYSIMKPTKQDKKITIGWNSYSLAKQETTTKELREFKKKLKPILKKNNIKFEDTGRSIIID